MLNRLILPALIVTGLAVHVAAGAFNGGTVLALVAAIILIVRVTGALDTENNA